MDGEMIKENIKWMDRIQAIAQTGMVYTQDVYDKERYQELLEIAQEMMAVLSKTDKRDLPKLIVEDIGYATPKLDVRVFIPGENDTVLLVRESQDGLWSLPGGWAEVSYSPKACAIKEVAEETGLEVEIIHLLALWDKRKHEHPPHWPHTYKCVFLAQAIGGQLLPNHEVLEVAYFNKKSLPELSTHRVTKQQLHLLFDLTQNYAETIFD